MKDANRLPKVYQPGRYGDREIKVLEALYKEENLNTTSSGNDS